MLVRAKPPLYIMILSWPHSWSAHLRFWNCIYIFAQCNTMITIHFALLRKINLTFTFFFTTWDWLKFTFFFTAEIDLRHKCSQSPQLVILPVALQVCRPFFFSEWGTPQTTKLTLLTLLSLLLNYSLVHGIFDLRLCCYVAQFCLKPSQLCFSWQFVREGENILEIQSRNRQFC